MIATSKKEKKTLKNVGFSCHLTVPAFLIFIIFILPALGFFISDSTPNKIFPWKEGSAQTSNTTYYETPFYMGTPVPYPKPDKDNGCFIWQEDSYITSYWHVGIVNSNSSNELHLNGTIRIADEKGFFKIPLRVEDIEKDDIFSLNNDKTVLYIDMTIAGEKDRYDLISFIFKGNAIEFNLTLNGEYNPRYFYIGKDRTNPDTDKNPFLIQLTHHYYITELYYPDEGTAGAFLPEPITLVVKDEMGNPAGGIKVWGKVKFPSGNTLLIDERTNLSGETEIQFQLEETPGTTTILLQIYENDEVKEFSIKSVANKPSVVKPISEPILFAVIGKKLPEPLQVKLVDEFGNPVADEEVRFEVIENTGLLKPLQPDSFNENWSPVVIVKTRDDGTASVEFLAGEEKGRSLVRASAVNYEEANVPPFVFIIRSSADLDNDSIPDLIDDDIDGDGVPNDEDAFDYNPEASVDLDNDGMPDKWNPGYSSSKNLTLDLELDSDGDGFSDTEELIRQWDPHKYTRYKGRPSVYDIIFDPPIGELTEYEVMKVTLIIIEPGNLSRVNITYKTYITTYREDVVEDYEEIKGDQIIREGNKILSEIDDEKFPLASKHQSDDNVTVGRIVKYTYKFKRYSTGERIDFYFTIYYENETTELFFRYPQEKDKDMSFKVTSSANIVSGSIEDFCFMFIPVLIIGALSSRRLKKKLAKVHYREVRWSDVHLKEMFFTVKQIFSDVSEVKKILKKGSGRLMRWVYFLGVTGLLLLAIELFNDPKNFLAISALYIALTLFITVISPVVYIYFTRWKYKSPTIGKLRLLFLVVFPFAIGSAFSTGDKELGYTLIFFFLFFIPLLMYANLMGSNWNFLLFNAHKEFRHGVDYLTNKKVSVGSRILAFFFFLSILAMPIVSINNIHGAYTGSYSEGGVIGKYTVKVIEEYGDEIYIQIAARFVGIIIVLNVVILGVAMVFRVIQLQFYASQQFAGRFGIGYRNYHSLSNNPDEQRRLISFCFFVFFGYSVLLLLLTIYSNFAYLLPVLPLLSRDILDLLSYRLSLAHNIAFFTFWLLSISRIRKVWKLKGYFDGFVLKE